MKCGQRLVVGDVAVRCAMSGHRFPHLMGPVHRGFVTGTTDAGQQVRTVVEWSTNPNALLTRRT